MSRRRIEPNRRLQIATICHGFDSYKGGCRSLRRVPVHWTLSRSLSDDGLWQVYEWIMKLYWIVLVFAASITPQKSALLVGALGNPVHEAVLSFSLQNPSNLFGTAREALGFHNPSVGIASGAGSTPTAQSESSPGTAKVDGIVRDTVPPRAPVPNALVKLFPDPPSLQHPDLIRSTRTDEVGNFVIENVVPGKYRAIAITGMGPEDLKGEATIAAAAGTRINLSERESKTLTIYLYPGHN